MVKRILLVAALQLVAVASIYAVCNWSYFWNSCVGYGCPFNCYEFQRSGVASSCCKSATECFQCDFQSIFCSTTGAPPTHAGEECSSGLAMTRIGPFGDEYNCGPNPLVCHT
jgi:hypothetical protein